MSKFVPNKEHSRSALVFCFHLKKTAAESYRLLREAYGEHAPSQDTCERWFRRFKSGDFDIADKKRGKPKKRYEDVELQVLLDEDDSQTQKQLAEQLNVSQQAVSNRLREMGKIQKVGRWVPRESNERQMERRKNTCIEEKPMEDIKTEVQSEDENIEECTGQSSFDLASNMPDILKLVSGKNDTVDDTIKEENINDTQKVWMDSEEEKQLASILDTTKGWRKLAQHFNFEYLLNICEQSSSTNSTLLLLNFIAIQTNTSLSELRDVLRNIGEEVAAAYMDEVLAIKRET